MQQLELHQPCAAHPKCQRLAATIVEEELELVAPFLPINRHQKRSAKLEHGSESKSVENKERKRGCQGQQLQVQ
jgi:hypothetical protein